jgi:hypothetical protein
LVFVLYRPSRPRDKSHYEHFQHYHSRFYSNVEPTSITPFSAPLREKALHAIVFGLIRQNRNNLGNENPPKHPTNAEKAKCLDIISARVSVSAPEEKDDTLHKVSSIFAKWESKNHQRYVDWDCQDTLPLMYGAGSSRNSLWCGGGFPTHTSMRNVDYSCKVEVIRQIEDGSEEDVD